MDLRKEIRKTIRESIEDEEIPGFGRDYGEKKSVPSEKEIERVLKNWYNLGNATWKSRGAPGRDGEWGGSFHYIGSPQLEIGAETRDGTYKSDVYMVYVDMGSVEDDEGAMGVLDEMLRKIGAQIRSYSGYPENRKIWIEIGE
jgi:hypothetical protein